MKRIHGILVSVAVVFMAFFISFGYAALTDNLTLSGIVNVEGKPYKGVYIKSVELAGTSNAANKGHDFVLPTNVTNTVDAERTSGTVTYKVTVHNNTDVTYWYVGPQYTDDYENNSLIGTYNGITITTKDVRSFVRLPLLTETTESIPNTSSSLSRR